MNERAEEIVKNYENTKAEAIRAEFDSLKPKPFAGLISLSIFLVILFAFNYFSETSTFESEYYWFFMAVIVASGGIERESKKINRRIDLLAKLITTR